MFISQRKYICLIKTTTTNTEVNINLRKGKLDSNLLINDKICFFLIQQEQKILLF